MNKENIFTSVRPRHEIRSNLIPTPLHGRRQFGKELFPDIKKHTVVTNEQTKPSSKNDIHSSTTFHTKPPNPSVVDLLNTEDDDELPKSPELSSEWFVSKLGAKSHSVTELGSCSGVKPNVKPSLFSASKCDAQSMLDASWQSNVTQDSGTYVYNSQNATVPENSKKGVNVKLPNQESDNLVKRGLRHCHSTPDCKQDTRVPKSNNTSTKKLTRFMQRQQEFKRPVSLPRFPVLLEMGNEPQQELNLDESSDDEPDHPSTIESSNKAKLAVIIETSSSPTEESIKVKTNDDASSCIGSNPEKQPENRIALNAPIQPTVVATSSEDKPLEQVPCVPTKTKPQVDCKNSRRLRINNLDYIILSLLGKGGSSEVFQAFNEQMSKLVAIKQVHLSNTDKSVRNGYINEINLLKKLNGSNRVISLYDFQFDERLNLLNMVMEKGDTDLLTVIRNLSVNGKLEDHALRFYWEEMLKAVQVIHNAGIIHLDLKPANFVLVKGNLKLIDFGIASSIQSDMTSVMKDTVVGTYNFMSPEAIQGNCQMGALDDGIGGKRPPCIKINRKSDVWSLGCILYALTYGKTPFQHISNIMSKMFAITNPNAAISYPQANDSVINVLKQCLVRDPKSRASIDDLLLHPFLSQTSSCSSPAPDSVKALLINRMDCISNPKLTDLPEQKLGALNQILDSLDWICL